MLRRRGFDGLKRRQRRACQGGRPKAYRAIRRASRNAGRVGGGVVANHQNLCGGALADQRRTRAEPRPIARGWDGGSLRQPAQARRPERSGLPCSSSRAPPKAPRAPVHPPRTQRARGVPLTVPAPGRRCNPGEPPEVDAPRTPSRPALASLPTRSVREKRSSTRLSRAHEARTSRAATLPNHAASSDTPAPVRTHGALARWRPRSSSREAKLNEAESSLRRPNFASGDVAEPTASPHTPGPATACDGPQSGSRNAKLSGAELSSGGPSIAKGEHHRARSRPTRPPAPTRRLARRGRSGESEAQRR